MFEIVAKISEFVINKFIITCFDAGTGNSRQDFLLVINVLLQLKGKIYNYVFKQLPTMQSKYKKKKTRKGAKIFTKDERNKNDSQF